MTAIGVPDVQPLTLLDWFDALLADRRWFTSELAGDYAAQARERVPSARPRLAALAAELASGVPASVQHDDLHAGNVFISAGEVRVIDWGDAVVAHPFSTLRVTLDGLESQLGVGSSSPELRRVTDAYLEVWRAGGESRADLLRQLDLALQTAALGRALGWVRALGSPEAGAALGFSEAPAGWLVRLADDLTASEGGEAAR